MGLGPVDEQSRDGVGGVLKQPHVKAWRFPRLRGYEECAADRLILGHIMVSCQISPRPFRFSMPGLNQSRLLTGIRFTSPTGVPTRLREQSLKIGCPTLLRVRPTQPMS